MIRALSPEILPALYDRFDAFRSKKFNSLEKAFLSVRDQDGTFRGSDPGNGGGSAKAPDKLPPLIVFPFDVLIESEQFAAEPVRAIWRFFDCFDDRGRQAFEVPAHVLGFIARALAARVTGMCKSLDDAFGGRVARQRNALLQDERDEEILFEYCGHLDERQDARKKEIQLRSEGKHNEAQALHFSGSPSEQAYADIRKEWSIGENSMRRIVKRSGQRGRVSREKLDTLTKTGG